MGTCEVLGFGIGNMRDARPGRSSALGTCGALSLAEVQPWESARRSAWQGFSFGNVRGARPGRGSALGACEAPGLAEVQLRERARRSAWQRLSFVESARRSAWQRFSCGAVRGARPGRGSALRACETLGLARFQLWGTCEALGLAEVQLWESARHSAWQRCSCRNMRGARPGRGSIFPCHSAWQRFSFRNMQLAQFGAILGDFGLNTRTIVHARTS